jgi:hypothetical protein
MAKRRNGNPLTAAAEPTSLGTVGDWPEGAVLVDQNP